MHGRVRTAFVVAFGLLGACAGARREVVAPAADGLSVGWIFSDASAVPAAVPEHAWCRDGRLLILDPRRPAAVRTFERVDPANGVRTAALDRGRALANWREAAGETAPDSVTWPVAFDAAGERAVYLHAGDVFVLELATARLQRLTATDAAETSASFSPDGTRVAFVRDNDLYAAALVDGATLRLTADGSATTLNGTLSWVYWEEIYGRQDIGYWWAPDSSAIAYLQTDEAPVGVVAFVDFRPAVPRVIEQRYPKAGHANPRVRVGIVGVDAGEAPATTWAGLDPAHYEYVARVKWLPDSARLAVQTMTRDQRQIDLYWVERGNGQPRHVLTETDKAWVNIHDDLWFLPGGRFLWASERTGYMHLYLYTLEGKLLRPVTAGQFALCSSGGGVFWMRQSVCAVDPESEQVWFSALEKSSVERHLYRVGLDGRGFERISSEDGEHRVSFSPDARWYVDSFSNVRTPPSLRVHRADGARSAELAPANTAALAPLAMCYPRLFSIPARDGFAMPAQVLEPADFDRTRRHPVILHVYSGPSAPTVIDGWQHANYFDQLLLRSGFLVVKVDNRSATAISKTLENTTLYQLSGDSEFNDLLDAIRWLQAQPWVDPGRIGMWGWSGGGTTTLLMMTRCAELRAGIAVAPVTDWHYYDTKWAEAAMKRPQDNPEGYAHTSLVARAKDLHGRLLLVHGTYDDNVHPQNAWHFVDALIAAGKAFDSMWYPMRQHGIADRAARIHLYEKMLEFWRRYL
jgi:dipeptidyl-peptidase-4